MSQQPQLYTKVGKSNTVPERYQYIRRRSSGEGGGSSFCGLGITTDGTDIFQTAGTMPGNGYDGLPTLITSGSGDNVYVEVSYSVVDSLDENSAAEVDSVTFGTGATPSGVSPEWNAITETWSPSSGTYAIPWALWDPGEGAGQGFISYTECGPARIIICSPSDIRIATSGADGGDE